MTTGFAFPFLPLAAAATSPRGALTEWDPRRLPPSMGGGTVFSKLTLPRAGVIDGNGETALLGGARRRLGLVYRYTGQSRPCAGVELDLFTSTDRVRQPELRWNYSEPADLFLVLPRGSCVGIAT